MRRPGRPVNTPGRAGFALVVVLVMVAVVALCAAASMRALLSSGMVVQDHRSQLEADASARAALRWCEARLLDPDDPLQPLPAATDAHPPAWTLPVTWAGPDASALAVPAPADAASAPLATCVVQARAPAPPPLRWVVVTARGFSTDAQVDAGGLVQGAQAWLQTEILLGPAGWTDAAVPPPCAASCVEEVFDRVSTPIAVAPLH